MFSYNTQISACAITSYDVVLTLSGPPYEVKNEITTWLRAQAAEFYDIGIHNLVPRLNKCLDKGGDYV
jgi:hypothetical protein